jgi:glycosyltransferase involved in cell wall biosynthesis
VRELPKSEFFCSAPNSSPQPRQDPYILYVGNLLPHKNLPRLLDAFALLRRRRSCRLIIRGEGRPAFARLPRERIESLGLRYAVTFVGYAGEDSLR